MEKITVLGLLASLSMSAVLAQEYEFPPETVAVISGIATVKDGDGILFGKIEIRLQGIAAPEYRRNQKDAYGAESRQNLVDLAWGKFVVCYLDGTTASSGRPVGICHLEGQDLGLLQVQEGFARDCPHFSKHRYQDAEKEAANSGNDLSSIYELPSYC